MKVGDDPTAHPEVEIDVLKCGQCRDKNDRQVVPHELTMLRFATPTRLSQQVQYSTKEYQTNDDF